jgi:RNA polymerase sigma factor (sigma-70 family)
MTPAEAGVVPVGRGSFPATRHSVLAALRSTDEGARGRALAVLVEAYWKPVFKYVRLRWHQDPDAAADLTQAFFLRALERDFFDDFDPDRARFRTFVRVCVDRFISNARKAEARLKRGGEIRFESLDFESAERELQLERPSPGQVFEAYFHREWLRGVLGRALARLKQASLEQGNGRRFEIFRAYDLEDRDPQPTYAELAREFSVPATTITNELGAARRELRAIVLAVLREQCATDREAVIEAHDLFRA